MKFRTKPKSKPPHVHMDGNILVFEPFQPQELLMLIHVRLPDPGEGEDPLLSPVGVFDNATDAGNAIGKHLQLNGVKGAADPGVYVFVFTKRNDLVELGHNGEVVTLSLHLP